MEALHKIKQGNFDLSTEEIISLLEISTESPELFELLAVLNQLSRRKFGHKGYVFTQIGLNADSCSINCKFCSMASSHYSLDAQWEKSAEEVKQDLIALQQTYFDDFFMMTTADYPQADFIEIGKLVRPHLRADQKLVANIGDFDLPTAKKLKEAGFTGAYHICRLREGIDTDAKVVDREKTLQAIKAAGLDLYHCIEPIGPEHSYAELAAEILRAKALEIEVMAAMRRVPVLGTPLYSQGQISTLELAKIVAVTNIVVNPAKSMNVHEPIPVALLAGVNQLYAEVGANPRDRDSHTEQSRGYGIEGAWSMLADYGYGPSKA